MKVLCTLLFLVLTTAFSFAQSTTQVEYNYMKKGYRQVAESGLDLKLGYSINEFKPQRFEEATLTFTELKRTDGSIAGIILKTVSTATFGSGTNYYCIPAANMLNTTTESFGWKEFFEDIFTMTSTMKSYIMQWLTWNFMEILQAKK